MAHPLTRRALLAGATAAPACISMPTAAAPARHPDAEISAALGRLDALYGVYDELIAISATLTPGTDEHDASADRVAEHGQRVEAGLRVVFGCRAASIEGVRAQAAAERGSASRGDRVCQYVLIAWVAGPL